MELPLNRRIVAREVHFIVRREQHNDGLSLLHDFGHRDFA
jgi:hypothetical protein